MGAFDGRLLFRGVGILGLGFLALAAGLPTAAHARFAGAHLEINKECETPERTLFRTAGPCKGQRITHSELGAQAVMAASLAGDWSCQGSPTDVCQLMQASVGSYPYAAHNVLQANADIAFGKPGGNFDPAPDLGLIDALPVAHPPDG